MPIKRVCDTLYSLHWTTVHAASLPCWVFKDLTSPEEGGSFHSGVIKDALHQVVAEALPPGPSASRGGGAKSPGVAAQQPLEGDHEHNQKLACNGMSGVI